MNYSTYGKELDILRQAPFDGVVETKHNKDNTADGSSIFDYDVELTPARGIIFSLMFSVPFWILLITTIIFLTQK